MLRTLHGIFASSRIIQILAAGWDISNAKYDVPGTSFSISSESLSPTDVQFSSDGTKMYIIEDISGSGDKIYQYELSTAWDISTASLGSPAQSFVVGSQDPSPSGLFFKLDGTRMYVVGSSSDSVYQYELSTAWDISTAAVGSPVISFSISGQTGLPKSMYFKPDGTKMYIGGSGKVSEYNLSSSWDVSTASVGSPVGSFDITDQEAFGPNGLFFKSDGTRMYIVGESSDTVYQYDLSTAWDVTTASFGSPGISQAVGSEDTVPVGLSFSSDGTRMYMVGQQTDSVYQYDLSTAWDVSTASFDPEPGVLFSVGSEDLAPAEVIFKPDGTKMYIMGNTTDTVYQYVLGTPWDISTASADGSPIASFSVNAQEFSPFSVFFKPDGTKMYIVGSAAATVYQYTLGVAWDVSTASTDGSPITSFSVGTQDLVPRTVFFKSDGTKMYILGTSTDTVYQYTLGVAWDVSTASTDGSPITLFSVTNEDVAPRGISFKDDGTKMYMTGTVSNSVHQYTLNIAWDVSSAVYDNISTNVNDQDSDAQGVSFKSDGTVMYMVGNTNNSIYRYTLV